MQCTAKFVGHRFEHHRSSVVDRTDYISHENVYLIYSTPMLARLLSRFLHNNSSIERIGMGNTSRNARVAVDLFVVIVIFIVLIGVHIICLIRSVHSYDVRLHINDLFYISYLS